MTIVMGAGGFVTVAPPAISANGPPPPNFKGQLGQPWFDNSQTPPVEYVFNGQTWSVGGVLPASTTVFGVVKLTDANEPVATKFYVDAAIAGVVVGAVPSATETTAGIAKIATAAQANAGTDDTTIMTPLKVADQIAAGAGTGSFTTLAVSSTSVFTGAITANGGATIKSAGSALALGTDNSADAINIGTSGARTITIGNTTALTGIVQTVGTGNFALDGVTNSTYAIGASTTTGTITIGGTSTTGALSLKSTNIDIAPSNTASTVLIAKGTGGNTVSIANDINSVAQVVNISSGASANDSTVNILNGNATAGSLTCNIFGSTAATNAGTTNIGTGAIGHVTNIGSVSAASHIVMLVGTGTVPDWKVDGITSSTYALGASTTTGTITIGGIAQNTGLITLGSSSATSTVKIQSGAGASTCTICEGTGADNVISMINGNTAHNGTINMLNGNPTANTQLVSILSGVGSGTCTKTLNLNNTTQSAGTATVNLMSANASGGTLAVNIVGDSAATTVVTTKLCTGAAAHTLTMGDSGGASGLIKINVGSGNFQMLAGTAGATMTIGSATQTGIITLGDSTAGQTINISSAASIGTANIVNLLAGATPAADQTFNLMTGVGTAGIYHVNILTGNSTGTTQAVSIGTGSARTDITLGGTGANVFAIANTQTAGSVAIGNAMTTGTVTIGGASTTGIITIGQTTAVGGSEIDIANTINTGTSLVKIANAAAGAATTVSIMSGNATAGTQTLNLAAGTGGKTVHIADGAGTNVVTIANAASVNTVTIGSTSSTSTTTINAGSGNIVMVGNVTKTTNPAFFGYLAATVTNKTGTGTAYTLGTDALTKVFDRGTNFTTAGVFTAPVTGIYDLRSQVTVSATTIATTFVITIVTTARSYIHTFIKAAGSQTESVFISSLCDMSATDTAHVTIAVSGEGGDTDSITGAASMQTYFTGCLVA